MGRHRIGSNSDEIATGAYVEYAWDHHSRLTTVTFRDDTDAKLKAVHYT